MFSRLMARWGQGSDVLRARGRRSTRPIGAATAPVIEAMESRLLLTVVLSEGFEGNFPADNSWSVGDSTGSGTPAYWDDVDSAFGGEGTHSGSKKGYCAGFGYAGTTTTPTYQTYMTAYMSKAINLSGLSNAALSFWYKIPSIETGSDRLRVYIDSTKILEVSSVVATWTPWSYALTSYLGASHTLKFEFFSDSSITGEGVYLDDISVTDNHAPTAIALSNASAAENQPVGTVVGTVSGTDPDAGDSASLAFSLVSGYGDNAQFSIDPATNQLKTAVGFDYETASSYNIKIRATDVGGLTYDKVFTVAVTNVNEAPTAIVLSNNTVTDHVPVGTVVGALSGADPDSGDSATLSFSLVGGAGDNDQFSIDPATGQLKTAAVFDHQTKSSYSIVVRATDTGGLTLDKPFTIAVPANHAPTDIALSGTSVVEGLPAGTVVGVVSGTDPDVGQSAALVFALVSGYGDNAQFTIDPATQQLKTAAAFDYKTQSSYSIKIRATDIGGMTYDELFTIGVLPNHAPTDIALSSSSIIENQPVGAVVGMLTGTDPDPGQGATLTFSLVSGYGDNAQFSIDPATKQLKTAAVFDYEANSSYSIMIRATDAGALIYEKVFVIGVINVNDAPSDIVLSNAGVAENLVSGAVVGVVSGTDQDAGQSATLTFSLVGGYVDNALFTISAATKQLKTADVFDFEAKSIYSIKIRATDTGGLTYDKVFAINITDVNEAPTAIALSNTTVAENQAAGAVVGVALGTDPDAGQSGALTFTMVSGYGDSDKFSIDPATKQLKTAAVFDRQAKSSYSIKIRATDTGGLTYDNVFTIAVTEMVYVDANAPGPIHDGTTWAQAYTDLQTALGAAVSGYTIRVAHGTYLPTTTFDQSVSFRLITGVAIYGGYVGCGTADPDARDLARYPSVLSGNIGETELATDNSWHVVNGTGTTASAVLDGFTITAGNANGGGSFSYGGGVYISTGSPTLVNCIITGNTALSGGGMYNTSSNPTLINCAFSGNAAASGGGIYDNSANPTLANCAFVGNMATGSTAFGGGMYNIYSSPVLTNCTFSGNALAGANGYGGAIASSYNFPTLTNCIVWDSGNSPIYNSSTDAVITYSDIQGGWSGSGNIDADPLFVRNPSVGADGKWGTTDNDYGDLRLQVTSPCIDVGNNTAVPSGVIADLAGRRRFLDVAGVADGGVGTAPIVDMGAYERGYIATITGTDASEQFSASLTPDRTTLQIWTGSLPLTAATYTYAVNTLESCELVTGGGDDTLTVDMSNGVPPVDLFAAGDGTDTLVLTGTTSALNVQVMPGQVQLGNVGMACSSAETILLDGPAGGVVDVGSLIVATNLSLPIGKNLVLRAGSLNITGAGVLDLAGNGMILNYLGSTPAQAVNRWLANGLMGAPQAIKTSGAPASLGMVDNSLLHLPSFAGQQLAGFSQVLVEPTLDGDTNLDGTVDQSDYVNIIANMGSSNSQWFLGDLNHDGVVTADDLAIVSSSLGLGPAFAAGPALQPNQMTSAKAIIAKPVVKQVATKPVAKRPAPKPRHKAVQAGNKGAKKAN